MTWPILMLASLSFIGIGTLESNAQSDADYLPQNISAVIDDSRTTYSSKTMVVTWDEPSALYDGTGGHEFSIRVKLAGTNSYTTDNDGNTTRRVGFNDKVEGDDTRLEHPWTDCAANRSQFSVCNPLNAGTTHTIEVAQVRRSDRSITVPTGTEADWVKINYSIPLDNFIDTLTINDFHFAGGRTTVNEGSTCYNFKIQLNKSPVKRVGVNIIWDEIAGGAADLDDFSFSFSSKVSWFAGATGGNLILQKFCLTIRADNKVEPLEEKLAFRLVDFDGINPEGSIQTASSKIIDHDSTTVSYSVSPSAATETGVAEQSGQIEITASLSSSIDSFCHIPWGASYAGNITDALTRLEFADFVQELSALGTFDFSPGETSTSRVFTINDDRIPENAETLTITTASIACRTEYSENRSRGGDGSVFRDSAQTLNITILPSDLPVIDTLEKGHGVGLDTDRLATVTWELGTPEPSPLVGFEVRWTEEVVGESEEFYFNESVMWESVALDSVADRSLIFPRDPGSSSGMGGRLGGESVPNWLEGDTSYVVQVGAVTSENTDALFSEVLTRVQTAAPISATVSVADAEVYEGQEFQVSAELSAPLSTETVISVVLEGDGSQSSAEVGDFAPAAERLTITSGETSSNTVSLPTLSDDDSDDETLLLVVSGDDEVELAVESIPLTVSEWVSVTDLVVNAGDDSSTPRDLDRAFTASWTSADGVVASAYEVGWVKKPTDGSIPPDQDWVTERVNETSGVFPSSSLLFRASQANMMGEGLDGSSPYLVRVFPVTADGVGTVWSDPVEVTTGPPIKVSYSAASDRVEEGGSVVLTATLSDPLSEDIDVVWGLATADSPGGGGLGLTAEEGDVLISGSETAILQAGSKTQVKVYRTEVDDDGDDEVFSPFVSFDGDIVQPERLLITIADTGSGGQGVVPGGGPVGPTVTVPGGGGGQSPVGGVPSGGGSNSGGGGVIPVTSPPVTSVGGVPGGSPPVTSVGGVPGGSPPVTSVGGDPGGGPVGGGTLPVGQSLPVDQSRATESGFLDTVGTTHEVNIDRLAESGITRGCNPPANSLFCPDRAVTRGEMATFMVRSFELVASGSDLFTDDDGNTHETNINALASAEITRGCNPPENDRYCPDRAVTRAQMATFLARAMELADGSGDFTDTGGSPHADDINRIASVGITRGCNPPANSRFCPDRAVTRGEMATFLIRAEDISSS